MDSATSVCCWPARCARSRAARCSRRDGAASVAVPVATSRPYAGSSTHAQVVDSAGVGCHRGEVMHPPVNGRRHVPENRLRQWRVSAGLTLAEVAALTGLSVAELSRVERAQRGMPPMTRVRVARGLGVPLAELFPPPADPSCAASCDHATRVDCRTGPRSRRDDRRRNGRRHFRRRPHEGPRVGPPRRVPGADRARRGEVRRPDGTPAGAAPPPARPV